MDSNLPAYQKLRINDLTYSFTTDAGDVYICAFLSYSEYFSGFPEVAPNIYSFNLELKNKSLSGRGVDKRIAVTVIEIVGDFLVSRINAVVYVCDPADGKGAVRARKFKSWFSYYEHSSAQILQINTDIEAGGTRLYTALLVHRKNKLRKQFIDAYLALVDYDEDDK